MEKKLLFSVSISDCEVQQYKGPGNGGQKRQKTSSAIRIKHQPSGAVGQCSEHREQSLNKKVAFLRMIETQEFKIWHKKKCSELLGKPTIEEIVEEQMHPKNIYTEIKDENGDWINLIGEPKDED